MNWKKIQKLGTLLVVLDLWIWHIPIRQLGFYSYQCQQKRIKMCFLKNKSICWRKRHIWSTFGEAAVKIRCNTDSISNLQKKCAQRRNVFITAQSLRRFYSSPLHSRNHQAAAPTVSREQTWSVWLRETCGCSVWPSRGSPLRPAHKRRLRALPGSSPASTGAAAAYRQPERHCRGSVSVVLRCYPLKLCLFLCNSSSKLTLPSLTLASTNRSVF